MSPMLLQQERVAPDKADDGRIERRSRQRDGSFGSKLRVPAPALGELLRNLATGLDAGVPLMRALSVEVEQAELPVVGEVCAAIGTDLAAGAPLAEAIAKHPRTFPQLLVNLVRAGEQSGQLVPVLNDLADFILWREHTRKTLRKAAMYPAIVITAVYYVVVLIFGFVLQQFGALFGKLGANLPESARQALAISDFIAGNMILAIAAWPGLWLVLWGIAKTHTGGNLFLRFFCSLPVVSGVVSCFDLARLTRNLAVLSNARIPLLRAMQLSRDVVASPALRDKLHRVEEEITGGKSLLQAAQDVEALPPRALNLIHVGEESGQMPATLARLAAFYREKAGESVARALALMTPILSLIMAVIVGGIAVIVLKTLYSSMLTLGKG
jgi:type IV pilus assembly protein PilC